MKRPIDKIFLKLVTWLCSVEIVLGLALLVGYRFFWNDFLAVTGYLLFLAAGLVNGLLLFVIAGVYLTLQAQKQARAGWRKNLSLSVVILLGCYVVGFFCLVQGAKFTGRNCSVYLANDSGAKLEHIEIKLSNDKLIISVSDLEVGTNRHFSIINKSGGEASADLFFTAKNKIYKNTLIDEMEAACGMRNVKINKDFSLTSTTLNDD